VRINKFIRVPEITGRDAILLNFNFIKLVPLHQDLGFEPTDVEEFLKDKDVIKTSLNLY